MRPAHAPEGERAVTPEASRTGGITRGIGLFALAGWAGLVLGAFLEPERTAFAYLAAWAFCLSLALGSLAFVMIHHLTGSTWFIALRRTAENAAATLPLLALLFLPILAALEVLYPWSEPASIASHHVRTAVAKIDGYLNVPFFLVRGGLYFAVFLSAAVLLRRWSLQQEGGEGARLAARQKRLSAIVVPVFGIAVHFAAVDWLMSLDPAWESTVFGIYFFAGGAVGALALLGVAAFALQRAGRLQDVSVSHRHALGKLLFTLLVFWGYIAFFQFFLIWIADEPAEAVWYVHRTEGAWLPVALLLPAGHFALPFFALLSRELKRRAGGLAAVSGWLLLMHYVDIYWIVLPSHVETGWRPHWADLAALAGVAGVVLAYAIVRARGVPEAARGDPRFEASLRFKTG